MIGGDGVFEAGQDEGNFLVTAAICEMSADASVTIAQKEAPPSPPPTSKASKLIWSGEVAPQKWSQLYMKVLTKLVSSGTVRLNVSIEATLADESAEQQIEETKAALRGLGLNDNVEAE